MIENIKTDICVIGAGSGGLSIAAGAARMGADVVLLEGGKMGGDCLNYGCVPSKALIAAAKAAYHARPGTRMGISFSAPEIDYAGAKEYVRKTIEQIAPHDSEERFRGFGVNVIREYARFVSPHEVEAGAHRIKARRFVIATGTSPFMPPIDGLGDVPFETNETFFDLREKPDHLLILGGGPIGIEMAQANLRLGVKTTVIEGAKVLPRDDEEIRAILVERLISEGLEIAEGALAHSVRAQAGAIEVTAQDGRVFKGSHLLVAVGRKPNLERLDLDKAQIAYDRHIKVGADLRTSNRKVYAIGDVTGGLQFTHVAGYHGGVILRPILFGLRAKAKVAHIPYATYTDPEIAQVGFTEAEARAQFGDKLEVTRFDFASNDRAIAEEKTVGFIKIMVLKGRPIGVSIIGAQAGEMITLWSLAIARGMKMSKLSEMIAPYPTLTEISKSGVGAYFSPRLFESNGVKRFVQLVQRWLP